MKDNEIRLSQIKIYKLLKLVGLIKDSESLEE